MSKFIVVNKNFIYILILTLAFTLLLVFNISSIYLSENTFSSIIYPENQEVISKDFDGDGVIDTLKLSRNDTSYFIEIKTKNNNYLLVDSKSNADLLDTSVIPSIKIDTLDLSRDGIPEIIITGSKNNLPITYIFKWIDQNFIEVFSSSQNIFGILNSNNSKTPEILSSSSSKGDSSTSSFIFNDDSIKSLDFSSPNIPSLSSIQKFIDLIQSPYEPNELPDIFSNNLNSDTLGLLWKLDKDFFNYNFHSGFFHDISWNVYGNPSDISWSLSFIKNSITDGSIASDEVIIHITVSSNDLNDFLISHINIE